MKCVVSGLDIFENRFRYLYMLNHDRKFYKTSVIIILRGGCINSLLKKGSLWWVDIQSNSIAEMFLTSRLHGWTYFLFSSQHFCSHWIQSLVRHGLHFLRSSSSSCERPPHFCFVCFKKLMIYWIKHSQFLYAKPVY